MMDIDSIIPMFRNLKGGQEGGMWSADVITGITARNDFVCFIVNVFSLSVVRKQGNGLPPLTFFSGPVHDILHCSIHPSVPA